jgi:hypothetical protein
MARTNSLPNQHDGASSLISIQCLGNNAAAMSSIPLKRDALSLFNSKGVICWLKLDERSVASVAEMHTSLQPQCRRIDGDIIAEPAE